MVVSGPLTPGQVNIRTATICDETLTVMTLIWHWLVFSYWYLVYFYGAVDHFVKLNC